MEDLREAQAVTVSCRQYASETELVKLLESRGFAVTSRYLDLRLDVANADVSPLAALVRRLADEGISISTLAEERVREPRFVEKLYELETVLRQDDPARTQLAPPAYNAREALMWLAIAYGLHSR